MSEPPNQKAPKGRKTIAQGNALGPCTPKNPSPEGAAQLPLEWEFCRFDSVAKVISGKNQKEVESSTGPYPIYGSGGSFGRATNYLCEAGTTVIGRKGTINSPIFVNERFWNVDTAFGLFPIDCDILDTRLLYYFCRSFDFKSLDKSTTIPSLAKRDIEAITVPLPPLNEQKRIVAKIEELFSELDAGEESLRRARHQLGIYRQSLLKQAFEGKLTAHWRTQNPDKLESPDQLLIRSQAERQARYEQQLKEWEAATQEWVKSGKAEGKSKKPRKPKETLPLDDEILAGLPSLPSHWSWVTLGELAETSVGFAFKSKEFRKTGIRLLRGDNIEPRSLRWANAAHWSEDNLKDYADLLVSEGDIILAMDRPVISSGLKVAMAKFHDVPCLLVQRVARISGVDGVENRFLLSLIDQQRFINHCLGHQTGTQLPHISEGQIRAYPVPLCSLPEQQEIVRLLDEQFEAIAQNEREIDAALKRSEALRQSILKRAFTGHLVPQDPADEPAPTLLARIQSERAQSPKPNRKRLSKKSV